MSHHNLRKKGLNLIELSNSFIDVIGSSTDNAVVRWNGALGDAIQNSGVIVDDTNNVTGVNDLTVNNNLTVTNDLTVENIAVIDATNTEAFLVRQNGDTGDIFTINSSVPTNGSLLNALSIEVGSSNMYAGIDSGTIAIRSFNRVNSGTHTSYLRSFHSQVATKETATVNAVLGLAGIWGAAVHDSTGTITGGLTGTMSAATILAANSTVTSGLVDQAICYDTDIGYGSTLGTGSVTDVWGLRVISPRNIGVTRTITNLYGIEVKDLRKTGVTTAYALKTGGGSVYLQDDNLTSTNLVDIISNSADVSGRYLLNITNDNTAATGTIAFHIQQDAAGTGLEIDHNADASALVIDSESTTANVINIISPTTTTGSVFNVNADALTTGNILNISSNSSDASVRRLVTIVNDNTSATGTISLTVRQDAANTGLEIDQNGNNIALDIDSEATTTALLNFSTPVSTTGNIISCAQANSLTTGGIAFLRSNSFSSSSRDLLSVVNDHTSATGAICGYFKQDAVTGLNIYATGGTNFFEGGLRLKRTATATDLTPSVEDYLIGVTSTAAARTITLPSAAVVAGRIYVVKDESGGASTNNITIATQGAETIDGSATFVINHEYDSVTVYSDGTNWFVI